MEQIGISQKCNLESLGFTLEPTLPEPSSPSPSSSPIQKETPLLIPPSPVLEKNEVEHVNAISDEEEGKQVADSIKIYQLSQRRTRRPFSVSEVQALVEAVETLLGVGTSMFFFTLKKIKIYLLLLLLLSILIFFCKKFADGVMLKCVLLMMQTIELTWT